MHLGNGAITPECVVLTYGAAAAGLMAGAAVVPRLNVTRPKLLLALGLGSLVFAAQAINVPVWPGISGHLVGGVLLATLLGPGLGAWTMAVVLALQAAILGDGGTSALGANILNMALWPAGLIAVGRGNKAGSPMTAGVLAALAVPLAAVLIVAETALFRPAAELAGWANFAALMLGTHLWIGVLEGAATGLLVAASRHLLPLDGRSAVRPALAWIVAGLLIASALGPVSSSLPDGYQAAVQASGLERLLNR